MNSIGKTGLGTFSVRNVLMGLLWVGLATGIGFGQERAAGPNGIVVADRLQQEVGKTQEPRVDLTKQAENEPRVGVVAGQSTPLTLRNAVLLALAKNPDIEIQRIGVQQANYDYARSLGAYDLTFGTQFFFETRATPTTSLIGGAGPSGAVTNDTLTSTVNFNQLLKSGGKITVDFNNSRTSTDNSFAGLNPTYNSLLGVTFTQPLLRNYKLDQSRRQTLLTKKKLDITDSQFRQKVIEIIAGVQRAYWDLVFARRDVEIKEEAVNLARTQLAQNKRFVEAGTLAPVEIVSVEAQLEQRQEDVLISLEQLTRAENALKRLILQSREEPMWNEAVNPVEPISLEPMTLTMTDAVDTALKNRPEMEQYRLQKESNEIDTQYFRNQLKPQFDFIAGYSLAGLGGTFTNTASPFGSLNTLLLNRVNELSAKAGFPAVVPPPAQQIPDFFSGGLGTSLNTLFTRNFRDFRVGFSLNFPFQNRAAKADLGRALAQDRLIETQKTKQATLIEGEVRDALQAVQTAQKRVQAARASRTASETQLASEVRRFEVGESTNYLVLERQKSLSDARGRELRAMTDYNKAVAELQRVMSTTLSVNQVQLNNGQAVAAEKKQD
ncbi:MAG: TolC family protein [Blastocatellia bacterium]|nr:TolC family protein [Blastocatellia bacterium]